MVAQVTRAAVALEHGVEDDEQHAVGGDDEEGGQAEGDDTQHDPPVEAPPPQAHRHLFTQQGAEHKGAGGHLGEYRGQGSPRYPHIQAENKNGVQNDVEDGPQHHGGHTQPGEALGDEKTVHAGGHQGKEGAGGVDGQVGVGVAEGGVAGPEPPEQLPLHQQEQAGQPDGQHQQHKKAVGQYLAGLLLVAFPHAHGHNGGAAQPHQRGEGAEQGDDRAAHPDASQRQIPDLGDISDVDAVYDAVQHADQLGQHGGNGQPADQPKDRVAPQVVGPFHGVPPFAGWALSQKA